MHGRVLFSIGDICMCFEGQENLCTYALHKSCCRRGLVSHEPLWKRVQPFANILVISILRANKPPQTTSTPAPLHGTYRKPGNTPKQPQGSCATYSLQERKSALHALVTCPKYPDARQVHSSFPTTSRNTLRQKYPQTSTLSSRPNTTGQQKFGGTSHTRTLAVLIQGRSTYKMPGHAKTRQYRCQYT